MIDLGWLKYVVGCWAGNNFDIWQDFSLESCMNSGLLPTQLLVREQEVKLSLAGQFKTVTLNHNSTTHYADKWIILQPLLALPASQVKFTTRTVRV